MKLPEKLRDRIINKLIKDLIEERYIEVEDIELFRQELLKIFKKAEEEEKELDEKAKEILREKMNLLEENNLDYRTAFGKVRAKLAEEMGINTLPRERMNQIALRIRDLIKNDDNIEIFEDLPVIRKKIAEILKDAVKEEEEIEKEVRNRIRSYSKNIVEGTPEWNIMYRKIYQSVLIQRGLA